MLIVPTNDWLAATIELIIFITSATALAVPVVALPAAVLSATVALPLVAFKFTLLVI